MPARFIRHNLLFIILLRLILKTDWLSDVFKIVFFVTQMSLPCDGMNGNFGDRSCPMELFWSAEWWFADVSQSQLQSQQSYLLVDCAIPISPELWKLNHQIS